VDVAGAGIDGDVAAAGGGVAGAAAGAAAGSAAAAVAVVPAGVSPTAARRRSSAGLNATPAPLAAARRKALTLAFARLAALRRLDV
jgi:hypothetical protein